jgi:RNA polymerase sigma factor (sigma-70 family)
MAKIRVVLVDDHTAFREALALILECEPDITVVGQAGSAAEARCLHREADVILVDLHLADTDGLDLLSELRSVNPRSSVLIVTASATQLDRARAVERGAAGLIHKSAPVEEIVEAVRRLAGGERLVSPEEMKDLLRLAARQRDKSHDAQIALGRLTPREREVLQLLSEGLSDKEIAHRLVVSVETVRSHMVNLLGKLEVQSRLQALVFAVRYGVVEIT